MLFTKGRGNNRNTISPGLSIHLKATHKQLAKRPAVLVAVGLGAAGPEETNYPPTREWQLVILSKEDIHCGFLHDL